MMDDNAMTATFGQGLGRYPAGLHLAQHAR